MASKSASAINTKGRKKRTSFPPDNTIAYASEGFCALSSHTITYSIWRPQFWRENDVNSDNQPHDQIVHALRLGKTDGAAHQPFDPGPQIDVFALDFPHSTELRGKTSISSRSS
jgi:hypothetical protein